MKGRKGFTLIELLVVIAIIAVLAAILFPVFAKARKAAQNSNCQSNMSQIGRAVKIYLSEWHDMYPPNKDIASGEFVTIGYLTLLKTDGTSDVDQTTGIQKRYGRSVNWVEALYPYMESITGGNKKGGNAGAWACGAASDKPDPPRDDSNLTVNTAMVNYAFNGYLIEQPEGVIKSASSLMMAREMDLKVDAVLRPSNVSTTRGTNTVIGNPAVTSTNPPQNAFLTEKADKALYDYMKAGTRNPMQHGSGSNILFADGHVKAFAVKYMTKPIDSKGNLSPDVSWEANESQWFNYNSTAADVPETMKRSIAITP